ncbi:MAG: hypothetical protein ACR2PL_23660 [Dehalococcoidia bacterium]
MHDSLSALFLVCFLFGIGLTVISLLTGAAHVSLPGAHGLHLGHAGAGAHAGQQHTISALNLGSLLAFLTWFGGIGYVLHDFSPLALVLVLVLAILAGLVGAMVIVLFLFKVLLPAQTIVDPETYRLDGTAARVTARIAAGATGEITYSKAGARRSDAAQSIDGESIGRDEEVVILSYQRGIAYVQTMKKYLNSPASEVAERLAAIQAGTSGSGSPAER